MNITQDTKQQISEIISAAMSDIAEGVELPAFAVEVPANAVNGDFSCNAALVSAKALKRKPRDIAQAIVSRLNTSSMTVEIAGPGFINFFVGQEWFERAVSGVLAAEGDYGRSNIGEGKRVLLEFVSANPTGPMHIGNARGGAIGDCLAAILQFAGYTVEREFYVNDAGNQIAKLGLSLDIRYRQALGGKLEIPEEAYHGDDIIHHIENFVKTYGEKYLNFSENDRKAALVDYALPLNIATLERDLKKYRIEYDNWFRESALHEGGQVDEIVRLLDEKGATYEENGAIFLKTTAFGDEKDRVLVRSNGVPTYLVPDIAYHYNKLVTRGFDIAIDIFGADHHGYVPRMNAALAALGVDTSRLKMLIMQMVRLVRAGETVKLSKRSGKAITLSTLLDEVPVDAARFFFNLRDANTHLDFDLDLAIEETSQNPVYYVQYAHARTCNILKRLLEEDGLTLKSGYPLKYTHEAELVLIRKLSALPEEITEAARAFDPSRLTRYVTEVAAAFHKFYDACRVKGEDEAVAQSRLALVAATGVVIRNALAIMKVDAPERM
ncbi:MAG: arginine--tRNA ligase [Oscillospiraceae bacterium]|nr:arginine--tRNA ligase [Oscillospiraceae bacterium]